MASNAALSALNRFGLGARHGELQQVASDPRGWLAAQIERGATPAAADASTSRDYLREAAVLSELKKQARVANDGRDMPKAAARMLRQRMQQDWALRQRQAVTAADGFAERIVRFWSNHFAVSTDKRIAAPFAATLENEAIRPHAFGRFSELLTAVETHPAMLLYLDNQRSVGMDSRVGLRGGRNGMPPRGLNENLAREILELHTLGVGGGYTQADVIELARAITGWSVARGGELDGEVFRFRAAAHEPSDRQVLGKRYRDAGEAQGRAILADLAEHPSTAAHLAFKLARHMVADQPPRELVDAMSRAFLASGGDLRQVYGALLRHPRAWDTDARKFKTPDDFLVSAMRGIGLVSERPQRRLLGVQARMGQPVFQPRSPAGFADTAADWSGPDALFKRVQAAQLLAQLAPSGSDDPLQAAGEMHGDSVDADTLLALRRAESSRQGLALWLASPSFQWRH